MISLLLLLASEAALVLDMLQTLDIKNHPELHETNVLLGPHPSDAKVSIYFVSILLANALIWYALPHLWRDAIPAGVLVVEVVQVYRNIRSSRALH